MTHTFVEPPPYPVNWYNYWVEIKYFDEAGTLQTLEADVASGWNSSEVADAAQKALEDLLKLDYYTFSGGALTFRSRIHSMELMNEYRTYTVSPYTP